MADKEKRMGLNGKTPVRGLKYWEDAELTTQQPQRKRWLDGCRSQTQSEGRWLVKGAMDEQSAHQYRGEGLDVQATTSKTLVRGERRANKLGLALGRQVIPNTNDPDPDSKEKTMSHLIDHGHQANRRQRGAAGL